jgi:acyl-CoA thioesterase I
MQSVKLLRCPPCGIYIILMTMRHSYIQNISSWCLAVLLVVLSGCDQGGSSPSTPLSSSGPRDGFGQRLGTDVTSQPGRSRTLPSSERPRIVAFGDSLTAGLGVSTEESYPAQLQRRLDALGYQYRVINAGVSGDTTAGALRRVPWVLNGTPVLVILEVGGNDGLRGLSLDETRTNLEQIIERLQQAGVRVVLAGMKLPSNYGKDYTAGFEAIYPSLAKQYRLLLIPFFLEGVAASPTLNQADGIHPTGQGYEIIVEQVLAAIRPLLMQREEKL